MSACAHVRSIAVIAIFQAMVFVESPTFASLVIETAGVPATQTFDGIQGTLTMPSGWRVFTTAGSPTFLTGTTPSPTVLVGAAAIGAANSGTYGFRNGSPDDRALGFLVAGGPARNIMVEIRNNIGSVLESLTAVWNMEKYRNGQAALPISFFYSSDGTNWTESTAGGLTYTADDASNALASPIATAKSVTLSGLAIPHGETYYLRWQFARGPGPSGSQTAGVGLDDFSVTGAVAVPESSAFLVTGAAGLVFWLVLKSRRPDNAWAERGEDG